MKRFEVFAPTFPIAFGLACSASFIVFGHDWIDTTFSILGDYKTPGVYAVTMLINFVLVRVAEYVMKRVLKEVN